MSISAKKDQIWTSQKKERKREDSQYLDCTFLELKENRFVLKEIDTHTDQIQSQWILICKLNSLKFQDSKV